MAPTAINVRCFYDNDFCPLGRIRGAGKAEKEQPERFERGKSAQMPRTHDLDGELRRVLSCGVRHADGVEALIASLRPFNYEAAQGLVRLHADPSLALGHHLPHGGGKRGRTRDMARIRETPVIELPFTFPSFSLTWFPFLQQTVGAGSPVISTSRLSLFPATTVMVLSLPRPLASRWILGGSLKDGERKVIRDCRSFVFL